MPWFTTEALRILRDPAHFHWHAIPLVGFVFYVYAVEIERRRWDVVLAGVAFWAMDWINEVVNALILHFTRYAALWTTTGDTSFQILVGLNFEICVLFSVAGIIFVKQLPKDRTMRILGLPNRWALVLAYSCFSVLVELFLHRTGSFHWAYGWWNEPHVELIVAFGYGTFYGAAAWVHDLQDVRRQLRATGALVAVAATLLVVFGPVLRWI